MKGREIDLVRSIAKDRVRSFREAVFGAQIRADASKWKWLRTPSSPAVVAVQDGEGCVFAEVFTAVEAGIQDWPDFLMQALIVLIPKQEQASRPQDLRSIVSLPVLLRLWTSMQGRQFLIQLSMHELLSVRHCLLCRSASDVVFRVSSVREVFS